MIWNEIILVGVVWVIENVKTNLRRDRETEKGEKNRT